MTQRIAARPLALLAALLLFPACDSGSDEAGTDTDGTSTSGDATSSTSGTPDPSTTGEPDPSTGSTTADPSDTGSTGAGSTGADSTGGDDSTGGAESSTGGEEVIEIAGEYMDNYGSSHTIDAAQWSSDPDGKYPFGINLEVVDNDADWAAGADLYDDGLFSRYHWFEDGEGVLWYCTQVYGAATLDDAIADESQPDTADVATTGCGASGFPWTRLDPVEK